MLRRSRVFRHLFLDVAAHPNLMFRSFLKIVERNRVDISHRIGAADTGKAQPVFAIPTEYTVFLSAGDHEAICAAGESRVSAGLVAQFRQFLLTAAGAVYDVPANKGLSFRLAADTDLGLERNEYYFAWPRGPMLGLAGRLDLLVRGAPVETFDVPEVPALGIGTTRTEQVRLNHLIDEDVFLPAHSSLWLTVEAGRVSLVNRSGSDAPVLVNGLRARTDDCMPVHDGTRIAIGPDIVFIFHAESPDIDAVVEPRPFTEAELDEVLGVIGAHAATGGGHPDVTVFDTVSRDWRAPEQAPTRTAGPSRLEVVGTVLTRQMFDHAPDGVLTLGSSPRCHIVLRGAGIRPVHAELALQDGRLFIGNRSGRRAVHMGVLDLPVRPGTRHPLNPGDPIRLGELRVRLEGPAAGVGGEIARYFGANHLGNLTFDRPQARLILDGSDRRPIVVGRREMPSRRSAISALRRPAGPDRGPAPGRGGAGPVRLWRLPSPYLWPAHAEILLTHPPRIQPHRDPVHGCRSVLFVNMAVVIGDGQSHVLAVGDQLILGNLILRCG